MKTLSTISLSLMLAACGGTSGSSDSISQGTDIMVQAEQATYKIALNSCGEDLPVDFADVEIIGTNTRSIFIPSESAVLLISGDNHNVCVDGGMDKLTIEGDNNTVYVKGAVRVLTVSGDNQRAYVFGDVLALAMSGTNNRSWLESVATYEDSGSNNSIIDIIHAKI
jgi:hypothetical protein